jgi:uncharacterized metal-binding protein
LLAHSFYIYLHINIITNNDEENYKIGQAVFLNENKTDLNIVLGLCVRHDSLFIKYSVAPITVFAVKDRVLCHNPLAAVYQADAYYKDKLFPENIGNR